MKIKLLLVLFLCATSFMAVASDPPVITVSNNNGRSADIDIAGIAHYYDYSIQVISPYTHVWYEWGYLTGCTLEVDFTECGQEQVFRITAWNAFGTTTQDVYFSSGPCD